jgi:hypothetical protein
MVSGGISIMSSYFPEYYGGFWDMVDQNYMTEIGLFQAMLLAYGLPLFLLLGVVWIVGILLGKLED